MKIKNINFIATANIKGNEKSTLILVLMIILVISLSLISSFSFTVTSAVNEFKEDYRARLLEVDPWLKELDNKILESIRQVDHVENIYMLQGMRDQVFDILDISDENGTYEELQKQLEKREGSVQAWSLIGSEKRSVIAGKTLDESPTFSCIIPSLFYPFNDDDSSTNSTNQNLDYIDGKNLVGKTFTVKAFGGYFEDLYNYEDDVFGGNEWVYLPALEYKLKIAGVYYSSPTGAGDYDQIYVSEETGRLIEEMALKAAGFENAKVEKWWNTPSLRTHYLLVDDYENIDYVYNTLTDMGIDCAHQPELGIKESVLIISNILSFAGIFIIAATFLLCVINLIQSTTNSLKNRRGEIGLLKAIGYKNRQVFACLCYEHFNLTLKGFLIGGGFSAIFILIANIINSRRTYIDRLYIVNWSDYLIFLFISLGIAVIVPLICQIIALHRLTKIQPKEAMYLE